MKHQSSSELAAMIASDDYWAGPIVDPVAGLSEEESNAYFANTLAVLKDAEQAQEVGLVALSLAGGTYEPLPLGTELPNVLSNPRQAIRLVEDSRRDIPRYSREYSILRDVQRSYRKFEEAGEYEGFDKVAERMLNPGALSMPGAIELRSTGLMKAVRVGRRILYMRPDSERNLGVCLDAMYLQDQEELAKGIAWAVPLLPVGSIWQSGSDLSKIVRADVVEATGIIWRDDAPKKPPTKKPLHKALLPRLAPGIDSL